MKLRRRHFVLLAVALLIGAPIAWRYRPLNETERKLVGTWSFLTSELTFNDDRTFDENFGEANFSLVDGTWSATSDQIKFRTKNLDLGGTGFRSMIANLSAGLGFLSTHESTPIEFDGPDCLIFGGVEMKRSVRRK
jgi:hypothetical protein